MLLKQIKDNTNLLVDMIITDDIELLLAGLDDDKGATIWRNFIRRTRPYEVKFTKVLKGLFKAQEREVLANMRKYPKEYSGNPQSGYFIPTKQNWLSQWLFAEMMWRKRFSKEAKPFLGGVFETVGEAQLADLVIGIDFDVNNPRAQKWLGTRLEEYSKSVNGTTLDSIKRVLREGVAAGESIPDLQKRVQKVFKGCSEYRAQMISRTETIMASNQGSLEAMRQSGVVEKKSWLTAGDDRVRPEHKAMNGETVALEKNFSNGLMVPGEPNCRCTITAVLIE